MDKISNIKNDILKVKYQGKEYQIDVSSELSINAGVINDSLKQLPSNYAFLCLLRDRAIKKRDLLEKEKDLAFSRAWVFYKESNDRLTNETVTHKAVTNNKYQAIYARYLKAVDKANQLISICKAYESKERILQTLSANIRKEL